MLLTVVFTFSNLNCLQPSSLKLQIADPLQIRSNSMHLTAKSAFPGKAPLCNCLSRAQTSFTVREKVS